MTETALVEAPSNETNIIQASDGHEKRVQPESRGILSRIRRGRSEGKDPHNIFIEIEKSNRHISSKNTRRRHMSSPRGVTEADNERRTEGLSDTELQRLSFDFDGFLSQHPLAEGSSDTPESEQRWVRQQEAMMACRMLIEQYIEQDTRENSFTDFRDKLNGLVDRFDSHYAFDGKQIEVTKDLIDAYYNQRQRGRELRAMYRNDRELVRAVTGVEVTRGNNVSVRVGPWGLEIIADKKLTSHILYRGKTPPTDFVAGGLADVSAIPPYIALTEGLHNDQTRDHERQHMRYAMLKAVTARHQIDIAGVINEPIVPLSYEQLEHHFRQQRRGALDMAKDEIFAYTFNAPKFPIDYFIAQDNNPYDYLHSQREFGKRNGDPLYREASYRVFVTEYNQILSSAAATVDTLRTSGGYSNREVIALLSDKPIEQWEYAARKLLEAKGLSLPETEVVQAPMIRHREGILPRRRQEQVIDVVLRSEDRQPNWYEERMIMDVRKNPHGGEQQSRQHDEQQPIVDLSFLTLNQMLYELTRSEVDFYNKIYGEKGLERYFTILDKITKETGKSIKNTTPTETELEQAKLRLFLELEKSFTTAVGNS